MWGKPAPWSVACSLHRAPSSLDKRHEIHHRSHRNRLARHRLCDAYRPLQGQTSHARRGRVRYAILLAERQLVRGGRTGIARAWLAASGVVRCVASHDTPLPAISAYTRAPRAIASSHASSTRIAAPSPSTKPVRSELKGRQAREGSSPSGDARVCMACQARTILGTSNASAPPARAQWISPLAIAFAASAIATADDAHATE